MEDIVQREELFLLQPLAERNVAWSPGGVSGDVQTIAVQVTRIEEKEKELGEVKGESETLGWRLNEYKVYLKSNKKNLKKEQHKSQLG